MKLIRVIQSKIVKKDNKYQVQSEKGKNLGTYDTKEQAEKRLKQVEMFKHMKKKSTDNQYADFLRKLETVAKEYDVDIDRIDIGELDLHLYDDDREIPFKVDLDMKLTSFSEGYPDSFWEPGQGSFYEDYFLRGITIKEIDGKEVNIPISLDSNFGKWVYNNTVDEFKYNEKYFPDSKYDGERY